MAEEAEGHLPDDHARDDPGHDPYRVGAAPADGCVYNVTIQMLPTEGKRYRFTADFSILDMGDELPPQVQADNAWGALAMSGKPRDVGVFTRRFERLTAAALSPEETADYVRNLSREIK
ncbi:Scr1 family TA system antitoxin-like transcriptional regulator [Streptomyces parvus]|uniref:Scr1 family TA system antitoxin-like transcriptional regulator n=1 Tax=Streptomyces parvus TaxID=66428 RepID=UPI0033172CF0